MLRNTQRDWRNLSRSSRPSRRRSPGRRLFCRSYTLELLEARYMLAADPLGGSAAGTAMGISPPPNPELTAALGAALGGTLATGAATPAEIAAAFSLHSLQGALHTIYLDFDGHQTRNTQWNTDFENPSIVTPVYSTDDNVLEFSDEELMIIHQVWERVSEDFRPFHVNVTTQEPGIEALRNSGAGDLEWGQRVVIGGSTNDWYTPIDGEAVGGVAYGSFTWDSDTPCFVFALDYLALKKASPKRSRTKLVTL